MVISTRFCFYYLVIQCVHLYLPGGHVSESKLCRATKEGLLGGLSRLLIRASASTSLIVLHREATFQEPNI